MSADEQRVAASTRSRIALALAVTILLLTGCGDDRSVDGTCADGAGSDCSESGPSAEAGWVSLDRLTYSLGGQELEASPSRLFYDFLPAAPDAQDPPLLVVTGGGPAAACAFLFAFCSGNYRVAEGPAGTLAVAGNPTPLTDFAHVVHIDARNAGFSHAVLEDPSAPEDRELCFSANDYNVYRDAADVLQVLSAFLESHPELVERPTYFLSESYGAARTAVMLNLLLFHDEYAAGQRTFWDPGLDDAVRGIWRLRFGDSDRTPEARATVFRGQILLQPYFGGVRQTATAGELLEQPESVLPQLAAAAGVSYVPCSQQTEPCDPYTNAYELVETLGLSPYDTRASPEWLAHHLEVVAAAVTHRDTLAPLVGLELTTLDELLAQPRPGAYRFADLRHASAVVRGDLEDRYGTLQPWDAHFVALNGEAINAFFSGPSEAVGGDPAQPSFVPLFLQNLELTAALITHAEYDLVVYSPAIAPTLASYDEVLSVEATGDERLMVHYAQGAVREVFAPRYLESGHAVCRDQPDQLHDDIRDFIAQDRP